MDILTILRDGIWQFIGAIVAVFAIGVTWWTFRLQRSITELAIGVVRHRMVLSVPDQMQKRVVISFDNQPVENVAMVDIAVKNSGTKPILEDDFNREITIRFGDGAKILSTSFLKTHPSGLAPQLYTQSNIVTLHRLLLNPGDHAILQFLVSSIDRKVTFDARITGVTELVRPFLIQRRPSLITIIKKSAVNYFAFVGITGVYVFGKSLESNTPPNLIQMFFGFAAFFLLLVVVAAIISYDLLPTKRMRRSVVDTEIVPDVPLTARDPAL